MVSYKNLELWWCCSITHSLRGEYYGYLKEMCFTQILLCPYKEKNSYYANWWNNISKKDQIRNLNNDNNATIFKIVDAIFRDIL
jgi:hypothetical protein